MLLSKRIMKLRKTLSPQQQEDAQKPRIVKDTKRSLRSRFVEIPLPSKYIHSTPIYSIHGDLPFMYYKGKLVTEMSLYNELKNYKDISISKVNDQTIITIKPTVRTDKDFPHWSEFVETLSQSGDVVMDEWAKSIKSFCHTYSKVMQRQSRKKMKSEPRKKFFYQVTDESNSQSRNLFDNHPCLKLKFRIKNHQNQLKEILINESLVKEMGYTVDTFITAVLQEGFPQMMPYDNPLADVMMKALIKNYFTIGDYGYAVEELICPLLMKNNFAKNMSFKSYFLMNYEDSVFGMDIMLAVTGVSEPYVLSNKALNQDLSTSFVDKMSAQEEEFDYFSSTFYDQSISRNYTNIYKRCGLRELVLNNVSTGESADDEKSSSLVVNFEGSL